MFFLYITITNIVYFFCFLLYMSFKVHVNVDITESDNISEISNITDNIELNDLNNIDEVYKIYLINIKNCDKNNLDVLLSKFNNNILKKNKILVSIKYIKYFLSLTYGNDNILYDIFSYINSLYVSNNDDFIIDENIFLKYNIISCKNKIKTSIINNLNLHKNIDFIIINNIYFFKSYVFIKMINNNKKYNIDYNKILLYYDIYLKEFLNKYQYVLI